MRWSVAVYHSVGLCVTACALEVLLLLQYGAQFPSVFIALCDFFPASVIGGNTVRLIPCRCSSGRARNSFFGCQNGRNSSRNALMLIAYNLQISFSGCCLHTRHSVLPLACWAATSYLLVAGNTSRVYF